MTDSTARNFPVGDSTAANPSPIAKATKVPVRAAVRNTGGGIVFVGYATTDVSPVTSQSYRLPPGESEVFILAPYQSLYVSAAGGSIVSVTVSDALPLV